MSSVSDRLQFAVAFINCTVFTTTPRVTTSGRDAVQLLQVTLSFNSADNDHVFNIFYNNANFSTIVTMAKSRASIPPTGIHGYHGFQVTLYSHTGSHTVIVGKCSDPSFEEALLQTIARLADTTGARLAPGFVTGFETVIKKCQ